MSTHLYMATKNGVSIALYEGEKWHRIEGALSAHSVTSIAACEGFILAGTKDGIWRSVDGGRTWNEASSNLSARHMRWLACPVAGGMFALAGTEPAAIFISRDGADTWNMCPEVEELRDKHGWFLPYSPEAGCVRGFAIFGFGAELARVFAAVEVGGVLISNNSGTSWRLVEGSDGSPDMDRALGKLIHPDVHSISVHPSSPDLVTAATGGGLYRSSDCGRTWSCLYTCYCRAAWVDPVDPEHIIFGPADGVSRNGRIEESRDGGQTWHPASNNLEVPWPHHMVERFFQVNEELLAILSNGELCSAHLQRMQWNRILADVTGITAVAASR